MLIPDLNLLVYAHVPALALHERARAWWEEVVNSGRTVGIALVVRLGFVRLLGNSTVVKTPLAPERSLQITENWHRWTNVVEINPGEEHYRILRELVSKATVGTKHINDAHLAALAIERKATLCSNDADFSRYPGLSWKNPL